MLIEISTLFYISVKFWDAFWLCYQLIIHAYSNTNLRKLISVKFSSVFFWCFSVEGPDGLHWRSDGLVVRTALSWSPDRDGGQMSGQDLMESRRALSSSSERSLYIVRTRATSLLLSEAASVRTSSTHRLDGDPTVAINSPARRILTLPHSISLLAVWVFGFLHFSHIPGIVFQPLSLQFFFTVRMC
jgi:hypothetical protein